MLVACTTGHVEIPSTVTTVLYGVGDSYYNLTSLAIPDSVVELQDYAFQGANSLKQLSIGNGLSTLGDSYYAAFYGSTYALEGLSVGSSLTSFGSILDGTVISSIYVDPANPAYSSDDGMLLTKDGKQLLYACARQSVTVPDGVEVIKSTAFNGKRSIETVVLADTVS